MPEEKFQGKELIAQLQAPTEESLEGLVLGLQEYAAENEMEPVEILASGPDPDGGYRAVIQAHNFNLGSIGKWIKEKFRREPKPKVQEGMTEEEIRASQQKLVGPATTEGAWEETGRLRKEKEAAEEKYKGDWDEIRQQKARAGRAEQQSSYWRQFGGARAPGESEQEYMQRTAGATGAGKGAAGTGPTASTEDLLGAFKGREKRKLEKRLEEAKKARAYAAIEVQESGISGEKVVMHQTWHGGYWVDRATGKPIPEPKTAAERRAADYHPAGHVWERVKVPVSPQEQLLEARKQRQEKIMIEELEYAQKQLKRERSFPVRAARGIAGFGQQMAAVGMLGVAGTAQAIQPGRGGPQRATRMVAPRAPSGLYEFGTPPSIDLSSLRRPLMPTVGIGGLGHLRSAVLPRMGQPQVRRTPLAPKPRGVDLSKFRRRT